MSVESRIAELKRDSRKLKKLLRENGYPDKLLSAIDTRALRSGRRQTGTFQSNRQSRWTLTHNAPNTGTDPQYGTEEDCRTIQLILLLTTLEFKNAPAIDDPLIDELSQHYLERQLKPESYRDSLLLEQLDFQTLKVEALDPSHGKSEFHLGHEDPTRVPKHVPENVAWRTLRSNLIQGDMTLREARIYIIKLIARYFELGEIELD